MRVGADYHRLERLHDILSYDRFAIPRQQVFSFLLSTRKQKANTETETKGHRAHACLYIDAMDCRTLGENGAPELTAKESHSWRSSSSWYAACQIPR